LPGEEVIDDRRTFRLGTNAAGYHLVGGLFIGLGAMLGLVVLDLSLRSSKSVSGAGNPFEIGVASLGAIAFVFLGIRYAQVKLVVSPPRPSCTTLGGLVACKHRTSQTSNIGRSLDVRIGITRLRS
jgi:hypothetical protein